MHDLASVLAARGHEVRVVCSRLGYDGGSDWGPGEILDGVKVVRVGGTRFKRGITFALEPWTGGVTTGFIPLADGWRWSVCADVAQPPMR